jgi:hypothetical protein
MPVLAVYQQCFGATELTTYAWTFQFRRVFKTTPNSRFVIKLNYHSSSANALSPATSNNQNLIYLYSPELCANASNTLRTPTGIVTNNKIALQSTFTPQTIFVCNEFPLSPIQLNAEYTSTQLAPTGGTINYTLMFTIYEIDGDIPETVIV